MIVLGIDAGVTTGLAIVSGDDQRVLYHCALLAGSLSSALDDVTPAVDAVIIERALPYKLSRLGRELHAIHTLIGEKCPEAVWIEASQWKNTSAKFTPVPRGISSHEKDAIRIARWYLLRCDGQSLEEELV